MGWEYGENISFNKPERDVNSVFLHCSASDRPEHDSVAVIQQWHIKRKFSEIGYHFFISKNGNIHDGRSLKKVPAAQKNHNTGSIAICLHGLKVEKFTAHQIESLRKLCTAVDKAYGAKTIRFRGHCEVSAKSCPVFDYKKVLGLDDSGLMSSLPQQSPNARITKAGGITSKVIELLLYGPKVRDLQQWLNNFGYRTVVDGWFGQDTRQAVESFQKSSNLKADGIVGSKTQLAMEIFKRGSRGEAVRALQKQLVASGYKISVNGNFEANTESAVIDFQKNNMLKGDGIVGPRTRAKLLNPARRRKIA